MLSHPLPLLYDAFPVTKSRAEKDTGFFYTAFTPRAALTAGVDPACFVLAPARLKAGRVTFT